MKKNYIIKRRVLLLIPLFLSMACNETVNYKDSSFHKDNIESKYICSMHPKVVQDRPGNCPICGMELVPVHSSDSEIGIDTSLKYPIGSLEKQVISNISTIKADLGTKIFSLEAEGSISYDSRHQKSISSRVSGRVERLLIKHNYQFIKKGQLIMEIYSPDLVAAQRELIFIYQSDKNEDRLQKAKERLLLLGMQQNEITQLLNTGKILYHTPVYSPISGYILDKSRIDNISVSNKALSNSVVSSEESMGNMGVGSKMSSMGKKSSTLATLPLLLREGQYVNLGEALFTIYTQKDLIAEFFFDSSILPYIKKGQKIIFYEYLNKSKAYEGTIGLIQPVFKAGSFFTLVRVYLKDSEIQVGKLVTANIPIVGKGWWIPKQAVLNSGNQFILFKKEEQAFFPREIKIKLDIDRMILVDQDISSWNIASNAAYMVDSESFLKIPSEDKYNN